MIHERVDKLHIVIYLVENNCDGDIFGTILMIKIHELKYPERNANSSKILVKQHQR